MKARKLTVSERKFVTSIFPNIDTDDYLISKKYDFPKNQRESNGIKSIWTLRNKSTYKEITVLVK